MAALRACPTGSYLRLIHSCITQIKPQGPSRTCNESTEEEEKTCPTVRTPPWNCRLMPKKRSTEDISSAEEGVVVDLVHEQDSVLYQDDD